MFVGYARFTILFDPRSTCALCVVVPVTPNVPEIIVFPAEFTLKTEDPESARLNSVEFE